MLSRIPAREFTHTNGGSHGRPAGRRWRPSAGRLRWQGAASVQFTQLMQQWQDNAAKVNQALQELADNLRGTDKAMQANEADTEGSFAQILGGL